MDKLFKRKKAEPAVEVAAKPKGRPWLREFRQGLVASLLFQTAMLIQTKIIEAVENKVRSLPPERASVRAPLTNSLRLALSISLDPSR